MLIDSHHHLWDLKAVHYPWLMAASTPRFFGDPTPIQRDFLLPEFRAASQKLGFSASVHIQVGAENGMEEAKWVNTVAQANPDWPMVQVVFCDLTSDNREAELDAYADLSSVRGVRQIVGRAPGEDAQTGTQKLIASDAFRSGLASLAKRGLSFDLQLIPELIEPMAELLATMPNLQVALCHAGSPYDRSADGISAWADMLKPLSALPNVTGKLSGLGMFDHTWTEASIEPVVAVMLDQFGAERLMFGSNFPVDSLYSDYETLVKAYKSLLPKEMHDQIFGKTASRFYRV